jgi:phenylacetate-coenzyme A ligase PaaK-like adenylate-forming protein
MESKYWDERLETLPADRRQILRDHRLRWQVRRCWDGSPFYRERLSAAGLDPATFNGLADLQRIPILRADDLPPVDASGDASRLWSVAPEEWWRETETPASLGPRILTDGDITQRGHLAARANWAAGIRPGMTLGAMNTVPLSSTVIGIPGVAACIAYACLEGVGEHWADDHFLIEIVDPNSGRPVSEGDSGVVVATDLTREGSPLIRFWTGFEADLIEAPCTCGRTSARSTVVRPTASS